MIHPELTRDSPIVIERINVALLDTAIERARATAVTLVFGYMVIASVGYSHDLITPALIILLGSFGVAWWRIALCRAWRRESDKTQKRKYFAKNFVGMAALGGALNTIAVLWVYVAVPPKPGMLVLLVMLGALAVAALFLSLVKYGVEAYMIPALIGMSYVSLFEPNVYSIPLTLVLPIYLAINLVASRNNRAAATEGIWQRIQLEETAQQLERARVAAEAGNRAKSQFLATMSHEIRTPMNGVLGSLDLLAGDPLTPEQERWHAVAKSSGNALLAVINDVLDYSKLEVGKLSVVSRPFDLYATVTNAINVSAATAQRKQIVTAVHFEADLPKMIIGDGVRLGQVLLNIVGNAIKFTEAGSVTIRVHRKAGWRNTCPSEVSGDTRPTDALQIDVIDTGIGIAEDKIHSIFEPFHQVDQTDTRQHQGTGLGLAIARGLVAGMGGELGVASTLGIGSTFTVTLPLLVSAEPPTAAVVAAPHAHVAPLRSHASTTVQGTTARKSTYRVLVAEDNAINRLVLLQMLRRLNITVDESGDGAQALSQWQNNAYDAILMDCQMPTLDGFEATKAIRAVENDQQRSRTPIIAVTANALISDRDRCISVGMDDYLAKPFRFDDLFQVLVRYLPHLTMPQESTA